MTHQPEEIGQILLTHALFIEGEDEDTGIGTNKEVRVLPASGDALEPCRTDDIVAGEQRFQVLERDFGVDGHGLLYSTSATVRSAFRRRIRSRRFIVGLKPRSEFRHGSTVAGGARIKIRQTRFNNSLRRLAGFSEAFYCVLIFRIVG